MTRRIGATIYKVKVVFNHIGTETMEDKILGIMSVKQTVGQEFVKITALYRGLFQTAFFVLFAKSVEIFTFLWHNYYVFYIQKQNRLL